MLLEHCIFIPTQFYIKISVENGNEKGDQICLPQPSQAWCCCCTEVKKGKDWTYTLDMSTT